MPKAVWRIGNTEGHLNPPRIPFGGRRLERNQLSFDLNEYTKMTQPSTPAGAAQPSLFGSAAAVQHQSNLSGAPILTPASAASTASSNNTFLMPNSPIKGRQPTDGYRPKITRTLGQRPACLVNASVTYCGNNQIYAFGGFDQYTDEGMRNRST